MRPARLIKTCEIPLADIDTSNRLRPVSETAVLSLVASIETLGLQSEIHVRKIKKSGVIRLIAGGHRVAAFKALGRDSIPAKLWDCTDDWAALAEIDDNLARAGLDILELSVFLARRKEVYERAYPETKAAVGAELVAKRWDTADNLSVVSFVASSAKKMGVSDRQIRRLVAAGQALTPMQVNALRKAPKKVSLADLQEIAKCGEAKDRADICTALGEGSARSAAEVLGRKKAPGAAIKDPVETARIKLNDAFSRAPKEARRRFAIGHRDTLLELLDVPPVSEPETANEPAEVITFQRHLRS